MQSSLDIVLEHKLGKTELRPIMEELHAHRSNHLLYVLFRSLELNYNLVNEALTILDRIISSVIKNYVLVLRGSMTGQLALKHSNDIDIDLILPSYLLTKEDFKKADLDEQFQRLCFALRTKFAAAALIRGIPVVIDENATRSLSMKLGIMGDIVDVDLFIKVVANADGLIYGPSKSYGGVRLWTAGSPLSVEEKKKEPLNDIRKAAIMLLKVWKAQGKTGDKRLLYETIKSYHLVSVIPAADDCIALDGFLLLDDNFYSCVIAYMRVILSQLLLRYSAAFELITKPLPNTAEISSLAEDVIDFAEKSSERAAKNMADLLAIIKAFSCALKEIILPDR